MAYNRATFNLHEVQLEIILHNSGNIACSDVQTI